MTQSIPSKFWRVASPDKLQETMQQLEAATSQLCETNEEKTQVAEERRGLIKQKIQLATDIKLTEADAIMRIEGEGRNQWALVEGRKVALANETARDAYRRVSSKVARNALAKVSGALAESDSQMDRVDAEWHTAKQICENFRAKANLQAALLNFLQGSN